MNVAQHALVGALCVYQWVLSPAKAVVFGPLGRCRFDPTCSAYAVEAVQVHGALRGAWLALRRLCRCHPWGDCGPDPVPAKVVVQRSKLRGFTRLFHTLPGAQPCRAVFQSVDRPASGRQIPVVVTANGGSKTREPADWKCAFLQRCHVHGPDSRAPASGADQPGRLSRGRSESGTALTPGSESRPPRFAQSVSALSSTAGSRV